MVKPQPLKVDLSTELRVSQALSRRGQVLPLSRSMKSTRALCLSTCTGLRLPSLTHQALTHCSGRTAKCGSGSQNR